jgi:hypothetical protein
VSDTPARRKNSRPRSDKKPPGEARGHADKPLGLDDPPRRKTTKRPEEQDGRRNSGRVRKAITDWHAAQLWRPEVRAAYAAVLENPASPHFMAAHKNSEERACGKVADTVELTGKDGGPVQVLRFGDREVAF